MTSKDERNENEEGEEDLDVFEFYTNATGIQVGPFDVSLSIAVQDPDSPEGRIEHAIVRMSPQHALVTTALLMKFLSTHERMNGGPMPLSPEMVKLLNIESELAAIRALEVPGNAEATKGERK